MSIRFLNGHGECSTIAVNFCRICGSCWSAWSTGRHPPSACAALIKWTGWTLAVAVPLWQHRKHCHGCCYY